MNQTPRRMVVDETTMPSPMTVTKQNHCQCQSTKPEMDEESKYDFRILYFAFFAIYLGRTLILPLLPSYGDEIWKEQHSGTSTSTSTVDVGKLPHKLQGILAGLFYIAYAIAGISFGPLSIRIGRKPVLLLCIIGMTFGFIGQAMAPDYVGLVSARTFAGLFAAINGVCQSYISDICKPSLVPKYTARLGTVFGLVFGFGPLFAVVLCNFNKWVLSTGFGDDIPSHKYRLSLAIGACITGISSILVGFKLKESLPKEIRVQWPWNKNRNKHKLKNMVTLAEQVTSTQVVGEMNKNITGFEVLSVSKHPDFDDVSSWNLVAKHHSEVLMQIRFNVQQQEDTINVVEEIIASTALNDSHFEDLVEAINESRALMVIPEDRPMTPPGPQPQQIQPRESVDEGEGDTHNTLNYGIPPSVFSEGTDTPFERELICIDHAENKGDLDLNEGEIDFATLFEAMLPEQERTPEFKARLKLYMMMVLVIVVIMDIATAGHATIFALLNKRQSTPKDEGLDWSDTMFGISWMLYGVSYSLVQLFYVKLQIKYGAFRTGALGCFIKMIGCILIPLLTVLCRHTVHQWYDLETVQWIEILIHSPASILNGIGYGLSNTATQTIISDYAKRYDVRSVGNWLGAWMGCIAAGAAGVIVLGQIASAIGAGFTFYVCASCAFASMLLYLVLDRVAGDIKIAVDVKVVIQDNYLLTEHLDQCTIDGHAEKSVSRIGGRLSHFSALSQLTELLGSRRASSLSPPLTPNLQINTIPSLNPLQLTPGSRLLKARNHSICTSDSRLSATTSFRRNVTESINQSSTMISLSSFNCSHPFGIPMVTPSQLLGIPMGGINYVYTTPRISHFDLKNVNANPQSGGVASGHAVTGDEEEEQERKAGSIPVLSPTTIIRVHGPSDQKNDADDDEDEK